MLSIVTVNYNATEHIENLLRSIDEASYPIGFLSEILVVDNGSRADQRERLSMVRHPLVETIVLEQETSFAAANNAAFDRATGRYVCILNPDTIVPDDSLARMVEYLESHPDIAAVGPRLWLDNDRTLLVSPNELPTFRSLLTKSISCFLSGPGRRRDREQRRYFADCWNSSDPVPVSMLSGACIVISRKALDAMGGFDERFPLYYEDSDFSHRLRTSGRQIRLLPGADIIHLYNKSGEQDYVAALAKNAISERAYYAKHYPVIGRIALGVRDALNLRPEHRLRRDFVDTGESFLPYKPPIDSLPDPFRVEVSLSPLFEVAVLQRAANGCGEFAQDPWQRFREQDIFVRAVTDDGSRILGRWIVRFRGSDSIRVVTPGVNDREGLAELFREVFGVNRRIGTWIWTYEAHGLGRYALVAKNDRDEIIANYSAIPVRMKYADRVVWFGQVADTMVRKDCRGGLGRQSIVTQLANRFFSRYGGPDRLAVLYGLPDTDILRFGEIKLGYQPLWKLCYLFRQLSPAGRESSASGIAVSAHGRFGAADEPVFERAVGNYSVQIVRDARYLRWRYDEHPEKVYRNYVIQREGEPLGFFVVTDVYPAEQHRFQGKRLAVCVDWVVPHDVIRAHGEIVRAIENRLTEDGFDTLLILFPPHSLEYKIFIDNRYTFHEGFHTLTARSFDPRIELGRVFTDWFFTAGDFDIA
ncbi:MAG: GNAT family N-acetyltransferase [Proteobacteria bacterium]|nr:MAG: GNAT family N-acetyltransferase [Pseudomonadota bacterium]